MPSARIHPKKVLILGSGGLSIGQAGEFDYSGSQAIKALKEEGIRTILVNPNIATIQTSEGLADRVYFLPVDAQFVSKVIARERPDGILLSFGGQTALNCGVELYRRGILSQYRVRVLGTPVDTIICSEDRELFVKKLDEIGAKTPTSRACTTVKQAAAAAKEMGYPVILRAAYTLGGQGSGFAHNRKDLETMVAQTMSLAPQVLVEKSLKGWKEVEYEVVRDCADNCITVCNMENFDPLGIHTGESIVIAPSQTLTNTEYHNLREVSIEVIRHLGIVGECNIQFALDPESSDYRIIEVNARLSRSSALASKATGYPLAFVAAKLALNYELPDIENSITRITKACFEPSLDYVVAKLPRWDLKKFKMVSRRIGSGMKSVGEVMAIGRKFEEVIQKGMRMLEIGLLGFIGNRIEFDDLESELKNPSDRRILAIAQALKQGMSIERIAELTAVDRWFLSKLKNIVDVAARLRDFSDRNVPEGLLRYAKQLGFSDEQIGQILVVDCQDRRQAGLSIRRLRKHYNIVPCVKRIDTLAGEFPTSTNYLYMTYNGTENDVPFRADDEEGPVIVLGSGAYRIGSSVEFDWCCVNCVESLRRQGKKAIVINYNPETVSTDYDVSDRLYFEELNLERILDICDKERPEGVILAMGGQIPNNLAMPLSEQGVRVLGTSPRDIDNAENRHKFSSKMDALEIMQPPWKELSSLDEAKAFARSVGYPVLVRPSYVLSGAAMNVAHNDALLETYLREAAEVSNEYPVVISEFIDGAKEIEMDAVAQHGELIAYAISEHVEHAGVHSGDATIVTPPQKLYYETVRRVKRITAAIASAFSIHGPFNVQYLAKNNDIRVIELNLRASRSFPFVSKVFRVNLIDLATRLMMGETLTPVKHEQFQTDFVGVKVPQFSFGRLEGADPILGVEMASTGEVACFGDEMDEAFLKAFLSVGHKVPRRSILLSTGPIESKAAFLKNVVKLVAMKYQLYATEGTHDFLGRNGIETTLLHWPASGKKPNTIDYIKQGKIDLVVNIPKNFEKVELSNDYLIRRTAADYGVSLITNLQIAELFVDAVGKYRIDALECKAWDEYRM